VCELKMPFRFLKRKEMTAARFAGVWNKRTNHGQAPERRVCVLTSTTRTPSWAPEAAAAAGLAQEAAAVDAAGAGAPTTLGGFLEKKEVIVIVPSALSWRGAVIFLTATASFTAVSAGAAGAMPTAPLSFLTTFTGSELLSESLHAARFFFFWPVFFVDIVRDVLLILMFPAATSLCRSKEYVMNKRTLLSRQTQIELDVNQLLIKGEGI